MASKSIVAAAGVALLAAGVWWAISGDGTGLDMEHAAAAQSEATSKARALVENAVREGIFVSTERSSVAPSTPPRFEKLLVWGALLGVDALEAKNLQRGALTFADDQGRTLQANIGPDATYSVFGVTPGIWRAHWRAAGYLTLDEELELDGALERVRRDFVVQPALRLPVVFVDEDTGERLEIPAGDSLWSTLGVVVTRGAPPLIGSVVERGPRLSEGATYRARYRLGESDDIPKEVDGMLDFHRTPPLVAHAVLRDTLLESLAVSGAESKLTFRISRRRIEAAAARARVRCVDSRTGELIAQARVELGFRDGGGDQAQTDEFGIARFQLVAPGARKLSATGSNGRRALRWVQLASGAENDLGVLALAPQVLVSGRVVGPDGAVARAVVRGVPLDPGAVVRTAMFDDRVQVRTDGEFELSARQPGRLRLLASATGFAPAVLDLNMDERGVSGLELRLTPGVEIRVRATRGASLGVSVLVTEPNGAPLHALFVSPVGTAKALLTPGAYVLSTVEGDVVISSRAFTLTDAPLEFEVDAP